MNRDQLVAAMRLQTDLDEDDLPLGTATLFLQEAFERTAALERRWPSYETEWVYAILETDDGVQALDPSIAEIASVIDTSSGARLFHADHAVVESNLRGQAGVARFFTLWGGNLHFWPAPAADRTFTVRGYRKPNYTWLSDTGTEVDLDVRLHIPLLHFAVALAYAQQEDDLLEQMYMNRWHQAIQVLQRDIMRAGVYRPVVLNGGDDNGLGLSRWSNEVAFT